MFNFISNHSNKFSSLNSSMDSLVGLERRKEFLLAFIRDLAFSAGLTQEQSQKIYIKRFSNLFEMTPAVNDVTIFIPSFLFINLEDLGEDFIVSSLNDLDEKMEKDPQWLQKLANKLADIFKTEKVTVDYKNREAIRLMVRFLFEHQNQPDKVISALRFILLHEIGHLNHQHASHKPQHQARWMALNGLVAAALTFVICFVLSATLFGMFIAIPLAVVVAAVATKKIREVAHSRLHEREADAFAMNALQDEEGKKVREGGMYLFNTIRRHQIALLNDSDLSLKEHLLFNITFSQEGVNRFLYFTHPSEKDRSEAIEKFDNP